MDELVRLVASPGQTYLVKVLKRKFELHLWIALIKTIKMHIWNVQFGLWMREIWLRQDLHLGQSDRPDDMGGRPGLDCVNRVGIRF
jgi:hypothetical protein